MENVLNLFLLYPQINTLEFIIDHRENSNHPSAWICAVNEENFAFRGFDNPEDSPCFKKFNLTLADVKLMEQLVRENLWELIDSSHRENGILCLSKQWARFKTLHGPNQEKKMRQIIN